ncbi:TetR family transcriptional regulator [Nocardiopsis sp. CC223A]|uniref:TetR family transcriptional regulator n=1 Tax=Nocardiopsis sp. CC223A TaxID=3044051 RepID=UPI00278C3862|nr:TetR family transcriptional regulator [Nocardiopsis sp. CC223A]
MPERAPGRRGRPPALTPEAIAEAVLAVGFPGLTVARVADHLGVGQATVFRHAANRDNLVRLGMSALARGAEWPPVEGSWRRILEGYALALWEAMARHPGSATEASRGMLPPEAVDLFDTLCAALIERGFTPDGAALACDTVLDLAVDNRRGVEGLDHLPGLGREEMRRLWADSPGRPSPARTAIRRVISADPRSWFERKLRIVLAGIAAEVAPRDRTDGAD